MTTDNFKVDSFQLMSGAPIAIPNLGLTIYQPRLFEVASIGEELFYEYLSLFKIKKDLVMSRLESQEQIEAIQDLSEYEVLRIFIDSNPEIQMGLTVIFKLLIKDIEIIKFNPNFIFLKTNLGQQHVINNDSFLIIKDIIYQIFNLQDPKQEFNPINKEAEDIANKILQRRKKLDSIEGKNDQSVLSDFVSILAVGLGYLDMNKILNLTIYQIFNIMKRFGMYNQYNLQVQALMQGAEEVELIDWLQKI